jgi:hypothetical protein
VPENVSPGDGPAQQKKWMMDVERRLRNLEVGRRLPNASMRGGSFRLIPEDGTPEALMRFGQWTDGDGGQQYGVTLYGADGKALIATGENERGLLAPSWAASFVPSTPVVVNTAGLKVIGEVVLPPLSHDTIYFEAALVVDPGTTAQVSVVEDFSGQEWTVNAPANFNGLACFSWIHNKRIGWADNSTVMSGYSAYIGYRITRTSGTGAITAYLPRSLLLQNRRFAPAFAPASATTPLTLV